MFLRDFFGLQIHSCQEPTAALSVVANGQLYTQNNITSSGFRQTVCGGVGVDPSKESAALEAAVQEAKEQNRLSQASLGFLFLFGFLCGLVVLNHYLVMAVVLHVRKWWTPSGASEGRNKFEPEQIEMNPTAKGEI